MKIGVSMIRDEADVVEATLRHLAAQVDLLVVADNRSTDETRLILPALTKELPLVVRPDPEIAYRQGAKMTRLATWAAGLVSTVERPWIVPFDADEVWSGLDVLDGLPEEVRVVKVPGFDHRPTSLDAEEGHPFETMRWREPTSESFRPKVAFRWEGGAEIAQGNHGVTFPDPQPVGEVLGAAIRVGIRHFPIRSLDQFRRKARNGAEAYAASTLPAGWGAHWRRWGRMSDADLEAEYRSRFWVGTPRRRGLVEDPVSLLS